VQSLGWMRQARPTPSPRAERAVLAAPRRATLASRGWHYWPGLVPRNLGERPCCSEPTESPGHLGRGTSLPAAANVAG